MREHQFESPTNHLPELPELDAGINLLEAEETRGALHALVLDQVLTGGGPAYWIDTHGYATTQPLARLAPDPRVLDRINVARGFTAFQHYAIVETLATSFDSESALIACPAIDGMYRDDHLRGDEGSEMLLRVLAILSGLARDHDLSVLVTLTRSDRLTQPVRSAATEIIECEQTRMGPRFVSDQFETLVYPLGNGQVQTTIAFWKHVLAARQSLHDTVQAGPQSVEVSVNGAY